MDDQDRYTRITLRIPRDLHALLQAAADDSSKSMNAEIIERVEKSLSSPDASDALQAILRIERDKVKAEIDLDIAKLQLNYLASIYSVADKRLRPMAEQAPEPDLLSILDNG